MGAGSEALDDDEDAPEGPAIDRESRFDEGGLAASVSVVSSSTDDDGDDEAESEEGGRLAYPCLGLLLSLPYFASSIFCRASQGTVLPRLMKPFSLIRGEPYILAPPQ